jgi:hypothetical protein
MISKPIEYKKFVIQLQGSGFESLVRAAGKVASFWVVSNDPKIRSIFAFSTSMMDFFENQGDTEEKILELAVFVIKQYIDENRVEDLEEYTFEYRSHQFMNVNSASWWTKTLKSSFSS